MTNQEPEPHHTDEISHGSPGTNIVLRVQRRMLSSHLPLHFSITGISSDKCKVSYSCLGLDKSPKVFEKKLLHCCCQETDKSLSIPFVMRYVSGCHSWFWVEQLHSNGTETVLHMEQKCCVDF
eukprot:3026178-Amphidinium_carterae.1